MKKTLSLILAVMMLLGCMSVTAFAEDPDNTTDITLTVAKSLTYDMVIPDDVTNLNAAGIYSVGQAKVTNVKNATDNTVISYTASTTDFTSVGKTDIPATYYTDAQGTTDFPTTAVEVYKNKKDAEDIPTMYVGISETAWNAAENGTYTATVTFNFAAEEVVTAADALTTGTMYKLELVYNSKRNLSFTYMKTTDGFELKEILEDGEDVTVKSADFCSSTVDGANINFTLGQMTFILNTSTNTYSLSEKTEFTRFSVKPAGATEFTEISLTKAVTAADALEVGAQLRLLTMTNSGYIRVEGTYQKTDTGFSRVGLTLDYEDAGGDVNDTCTLNGSNCIVFTCDAGSGVEIEINPETGMLNIINGRFTKFEVKPAGATEFTKITLTLAK